jgi:hypothetical protein
MAKVNGHMSVPGRVYLPLTIYILWFIANALFDDLSSKDPPDSLLARAYLQVFGHRRWLFTWPLVAGFIWGMDTILRKLFSWARRPKA